VTAITSQFSNQVSPRTWEAAGSCHCIGSVSGLVLGLAECDNHGVAFLSRFVAGLDAAVLIETLYGAPPAPDLDCCAPFEETSKAFQGRGWSCTRTPFMARNCVDKP